MKTTSSAILSRQRATAAGRQKAFAFASSAVQEPRPEMLCFRKQTFATLCHFFEVSCQVGRIISLLGREFFHAKVSHHTIPSFENQAVFVHDVERCLKRLPPHEYELLTMVGLYGLSKEEIAERLGRTRAAVNTRFQHALDRLSEMFLLAGLLSEASPDRRQQQVQRRPLPQRVAPAAMRGPVPKKPSASVSAVPLAGASRPGVAAQDGTGPSGARTTLLPIPQYLVC